jgi:hypothetical protein
MPEMPENDSVSPTDLYKIALDTRNLEINLFWQRCNYFLVLNSAVALGYIKVDEGPLQWWVTVLGMIVCYLWHRVALGSKYWQERWEYCLAQLERELIDSKKFSTRTTLFSTKWPDVRKEVETSLANSNHRIFERLIDKQVLTKPSVTQSMFYLVWVFLIGWFLLFIHHTIDFNYIASFFTI